MKKYEAPKLFVDEFVQDTMIASSAAIRNGNAGNQTCYTQRTAAETGTVYTDGGDTLFCHGPI